MTTKNIGTLYRYELKKIFGNKLTIAMVIVLTLAILALGKFADTGYTKDFADLQRSLNGRAIDNELLNEMYHHIDDYATRWDKTNTAYERLAHFEEEVIGYGTKLADYTAEDIYQILEKNRRSILFEDFLTDSEINWWTQQEEKIAKPFTYYYNYGPVTLSQELLSVCIVMLLLAATCLSTVFVGEHRQRTDQIIFSCANGKRATYFAKLAAGFTFMVSSFLFSFGLLVLIYYFTVGLDGMNAIIQLELPLSSYPLTIGQFISIQFVLILTACLLFAAVAMVFAEIFHNALATMSLMIGCFLVTQLVHISPEHPILFRIINWMPTNIVAIWSLMNHHLVSIGGHFLTNYHVAPILYLLGTVILYFVGRWTYCKFQVTGR